VRRQHRHPRSSPIQSSTLDERLVASSRAQLRRSRDLLVKTQCAVRAYIPFARAGEHAPIWMLSIDGLMIWLRRIQWAYSNCPEIQCEIDSRPSAFKRTPRNGGHESAGTAQAGVVSRWQLVFVGRARSTRVGVPHHRPSSCGLRWLRDSCAPALRRGACMKDWLVPPVLFPIFLVLLIVGYWILRTPT
jgi:hypothetical protein